MPSVFPELLARIAAALDKHSLPYMLIGGQAVLVYGEPRLTRDIDITLGAGPERLADIVRAAEGAGLRPLVDPGEFARQTFVVPCADDASGIRVDLILSFSPYEQQALARARAVDIGPARVRVASPEDVIVHKMVAGRPRDLEDVASIVAKVAILDGDYITRWLREFESVVSRPLVEPFLRIFHSDRPRQ